MTALRIVIVFLLFALFLVTPAFAENHTAQSCRNSTHTQIVFTGNPKDAIDIGIPIEQWIPCAFGCDNSTGACRDMGSITNYGWLAFGSQLIFLLFCMFMVGFWETKKEYTASSIFKFMFMFLGLITIWSMFSTSGMIGSDALTTEIGGVSNIMFTWAGATTYITVFFLFYFMVLLMINILSVLKTRKKRGQDKVIGDLGELNVK